jgi:crotonobetainyl-CoA:carnitine CoA-transferase CaiB-like acyl-CoA transferase
MKIHAKINVFEGLKAVELSSVLAGPSVGLFLAELGAEVIKIEHPGTGGDVTRRWKVPEEAAEAPISAYYASINAGKQVVWADLKATGDKDRVLGLISQADIVIANYLPASARKLGLDATTLTAQFPRLICLELTGFGADSDRPAFDIVLQAETGFIGMMGAAGARGYARMPVALIDLLAGHQLKEGLLLALWQREKTGLGGMVSVSLYDAAIASLANQASNWLNAHHLPQRMGTQHPNIAPYGDVFFDKAGLPFVLAVGSDTQFEALVAVLEIKNAIPKGLASNALRVKSRKKLIAFLQAPIVLRLREELLVALSAAGVPAGAVLGLDEVFDNEAAQNLVYSADFEGIRHKIVRSVVFDYRPNG